MNKNIMTRKFGFARPRNKYGVGGSTAEFGPVLFVFFLIILFPLINLIMFAAGIGTAYLAAKQAASRASTQSTFTEALTVVQQESTYFVSSGFGQFAKLRPVGGAGGSGMDLSVVATPYPGPGSSTESTVNTPMPSAADPDANTYEYKVTATFDIGPFTDLSAVPWIGGVPGLGPPARMNFVATGSAEFPEGLNQ